MKQTICTALIQIKDKSDSEGDCASPRVHSRREHRCHLGGGRRLWEQRNHGNSPFVCAGSPQTVFYGYIHDSIFSFRCTRWSLEAWRTVTVGSRKEIESSRSTGGARRGSAIGRRSVSSRYGMWCRSDCCYLHHRDPPARFGDFHKHRAPPFYWVPSMVSTHHNRSACRVLFYSLQWRPFIMFLLTLWRSRVRRWSLLRLLVPLCFSAFLALMDGDITDTNDCVIGTCGASAVMIMV